MVRVRRSAGEMVGNRDIWTVSVSGGPARQLTTNDGTDQFPVWSPDGRELAFRSSPGGLRGLWAVPAGGGEGRLITPDVSGAPRDWSSDGEWVLVGNGTVVHVASGEPRALSNNSMRVSRYSRDESRVFFARGMNLWAVSVDDGSERQLTELDDASRRGGLVRGSLAATDEYLYFTWGEWSGDIWVMDVVNEE